MNKLEHEEKNPLDDRDEFERRVRCANNWKNNLSLDYIIDTLVEGNIKRLETIKQEKLNCENYINELLVKYDQAKDRAAKEAVVGSVRKNQYIKSI